MDYWGGGGGGKRVCWPPSQIIGGGIHFLRLNEDDILAQFSFGVHDIPWLQIVKNIYSMFLNFLLNYTLCRLLESP